MFYLVLGEVRLIPRPIFRFIVLQGLSGVAGGFLSVVQLVLYYVKLFILGSTPRSVYDIKFGPRTVEWGTLFPSITLLTVISESYNNSMLGSVLSSSSIRLFDHLSNHQWVGSGCLFLVLPPLQISVSVPIHSASFFGYRRTVLSPRNSACIRGSLCTAGEKSFDLLLILSNQDIRADE